MRSAARPKQAGKAAAKRSDKGRSVASVAKKVQRPAYTPEERDATHEQVCALIETGMSTVRACEQVGVQRSLWNQWMDAGFTNVDRYMRARERCADALAEGILTVVDDMDEDHQSRRVRMDGRKWVAARLFPKRWGDRIDVTSDGEKLSGGVVLLPVVMLPTPQGEQPAVQTAEVVRRPSNTLASLQAELPPTTGFLR